MSAVAETRKRSPPHAADEWPALRRHFVGNGSEFASSDGMGSERIRRAFYRQFSHPTGILGWFVGHLMAIKNRERSEWLIPLLDIKPNQRVLEIGFGPGVDIERVSRAAPGVFVAGVDHSEVMLVQARKRNAAAIRDRRVDLHLGNVYPLSFADATFDRVFAVNNVQFWPDRAAAFRELRRVLKLGGALAIAIQPRNAGASAATTREWGEKLAKEMLATGFEDVRAEIGEMRPVPVVCVIGTRLTA